MLFNIILVARLLVGPHHIQNHPVECNVTRFRSSESEPEAIDKILKLNRCVCSKLFFHVKFYGGVVESSTVCGP